MDKSHGFFKFFFRDISIQFIGSIVAQIIPFLFIPILSQLFDPLEFGYLTKFQAVGAILVVFVGFRYYNAIVLPKSEKTSLSLFYISIVSTVLISIIIFFGFLIINNFTSYFEELKYSYIIFPLFVFFHGINITLIQYSVRQKKFKTNSISKVLLSLNNNSSSLIFGFFQNTYGLIYGKLIGLFSSIIYLFYKLKINYKNLVTTNDLKGAALEYFDFPRYTIYPALLDTLSIQLVVLFIDFYFDSNILGQFGFMIMLIGAPLSIISFSLKDVFYQRISNAYNNKNNDRVNEIFYLSLKFLILVSIIITGLFFTIGEKVFYIFIEDKWSQAFSFAEILIFSFLIKMIVSPLSTVFNVFNKLKILSIWQLIAFSSTLLTMFICLEIFKLSIYDLLVIYMTLDIFLYLFYLFLQIRVLNTLKL